MTPVRKDERNVYDTRQYVECEEEPVGRNERIRVGFHRKHIVLSRMPEVLVAKCEQNYP